MSFCEGGDGGEAKGDGHVSVKAWNIANCPFAISLIMSKVIFYHQKCLIFVKCSKIYAIEKFND